MSHSRMSDFHDEKPGRASADFIRRVHRRRLACRVAENVGRSLLIGCAVAGVTMVLVAIRGAGSVEPLSITLIILAIAATCAILIGARRSASLLDTAIEIDRQLRTPDLLSSALLTAPAKTAPYVDPKFARTLLTLADARVANVSPADLMLRRFTTRAWSGVGLAMASVVTLALLVTTSPPITRARPAIDDDRSFARSSSQEDRRSHATSPNQVSREAGARANANEPADDSDSERNSRDGKPKGVQRASGGQGAGSARTDDSRELVAREAPMTGVGARAVEPTVPAAPSAAGVGRAARDINAGPARDGVVTLDRATRITAPWSSNTWPTDRAAARDAIGAGGSVPPTYRDLVRDYFDLEQALRATACLPAEARCAV